MKRFSSLLIAVSLSLNCSLAFSRTTTFYSNNTTTAQQDSPLTLAQVQALLKNRTPDSAVAIEIRRRGIDFTPSAPILEQLRKLGAGGKTLKALEETIASTKRPQSQQNKFVILVADFKSLDDKNYGVTESLIERLREATEEYPDTEIKALNAPITAQEGDAPALAIAKEHGANMVLWGWYAKNRESLMLNLHCQLPHSPPNLILLKEKQTLIVPASELESFSIQIRVADEMAYLSLFIVGVARLEAEDHEGAIARLTKAINLASVPTSMVNPADTYVYRALSYFAKEFNSGGFEFTNALADLDQALVLDPRRSEAYALRGLLLTLKDETQKALADFSKSIELDAENAFAYAMRGILYKDLGENERAKSDFQQALKLTEQPVDDAKNQFIRGYTYLLNDEYDRAIAVFDQLAKLNPDVLPQVYVLRAIANGVRKNNDAAILDLSKAINLNPDHALLYVLRAAVYEEKEDYDKAIGDYSRASKLEPRNANFLMARGSAYNSKGDSPNALADYDRAISIKPNDSQIYSARARVYEKLKEYERAEADLNKAVALSPEDEDVYQNRARFYQERGDYDRAILDHNEIIKRAPNVGSNFFHRGHLYFTKGALDLAIQDYDKSIQLSTETAVFYSFRADAYAAKGDDEKALADYAKAIDLDPKTSFYYFRRARFYETKGDYERAIADYDQAKKAKPDDELAQSYRHIAINKIISRGWESQQKGDLEAALKDYDRALELEDTNVVAYYARGNLYTKKGKLDRAIQDFNAAIRLEPKDDYYFARAVAYETKGLIDEAIRDYRKALELAKNDRLRQLVQDALKRLAPK